MNVSTLRISKELRKTCHEVYGCSEQSWPRIEGSGLDCGLAWRLVGLFLTYGSGKNVITGI